MTTLLQKTLILLAGTFACTQFAVGADVIVPGSSVPVNRKKCKNGISASGYGVCQNGGVSVPSLDFKSLLEQVENKRTGSAAGQFIDIFKSEPHWLRGLAMKESIGGSTLKGRRDRFDPADLVQPPPTYGSQWYVGMFQHQWGSGLEGSQGAILKNNSKWLDGDPLAQVDHWLNHYFGGPGGAYNGCATLLKMARTGEEVTIQNDCTSRYGASPLKKGDKHVIDYADALVCLQFQTGSGKMAQGRNAVLGGNPCNFHYAEMIRQAANQKAKTPTGKSSNGGVDGIQCMKGQPLPLPPVEEARVAEGVDPNAQIEPKDDSNYSQKCESLMSDDLSKRGVSKLPKMPIGARSGNPQYLISGRYGKLRPQGHYHNGLDFSATHGTALYAADSGKVVLSGTGPVMGNQIAIRREGTNDVIHYGHLSRRDVKAGQTVSAGEQIGLSGGTPGTAGAGRSTGPHLHFQYFVPPSERQDTLVFTRDGTRVAKKGGYKMSFEGVNKVITTDPSPYLPLPVKMKDGDWKQLGDNTWHQYCVLRELTGKAGSFSDYSSMMDRIESQVDCNSGSTASNDSGSGEWTEWLPDVGGWGDPDDVLGMSPDGVEDHRSFLERALEAAAYRFGSEHWARKILHMTDRKLWMDYMLARRTQTWLEYHITRKRDQINMNLAVLLANAADDSTAQAQTAAARATQRAKVD